MTIRAQAAEALVINWQTWQRAPCPKRTTPNTTFVVDRRPPFCYTDSNKAVVLLVERRKLQMKIIFLVIKTPRPTKATKIL